MEEFELIQQAPVKKAKAGRLNLSLSRLIADSPGLTGASITGGQQTGKSVYAMMVMYELYNHDIEEMFRHIAFSIKDLAILLRNAIIKRDRMICVLWDDSSVHGSASRYNTDRRLVQFLSALGDTMGIAVKGFLMTSPSGDIIKAFRNYNFYKVQTAFGRHKNDRVARGYQKGTSPYGQSWFSLRFEDRFDLTSAHWYNRYYQLREKLSLSTILEMDKVLDAEDTPARFTKKGKKYTNIEIDE